MLFISNMKMRMFCTNILGSLLPLLLHTFHDQTSKRMLHKENLGFFELKLLRLTSSENLICKSITENVTDIYSFI